MAALGMETASGEFEVIDVCYAGLPQLASPSDDPSNQIQEPTKPSTSKGKGKAPKQETAKKIVEAVKDSAMAVDDEEQDGSATEPKWVAMISGVSAGSAEVPEDLKTELLTEWLVGEAGGMEVSLSELIMSGFVTE